MRAVGCEGRWPVEMRGVDPWESDRQIRLPPIFARVRCPIRLIQYDILRHEGGWIGRLWALVCRRVLCARQVPQGNAERHGRLRRERLLLRTPRQHQPPLAVRRAVQRRRPRGRGRHEAEPGPAQAAPDDQGPEGRGHRAVEPVPGVTLPDLLHRRRRHHHRVPRRHQAR
ncbi:uncharacterized protein K444DRAFT_392818 [Hyaloscypha bicolor E]|uniref:Uncharacterized protein n=1 Tax=Hyaloscypha bicolor E TaxID=1095630 RepID=A0A2J6TBM9_9HELO|nr:uncharacterized protein K444DRAFT_392818 [Hyaloscypha bicolor E]PMD60440.1 hypothetical protein K444DRAFT_392818 [Hyaloscypha bicolor E]